MQYQRSKSHTTNQWVTYSKTQSGWRSAYIRITVLVHHLASCTRHQFSEILEFGTTGSTLKRYYFHRYFVFEDTCGVTEGTEDMNCVLFGGSDDLLFDVLVNRAMENCQKNNDNGRKTFYTFRLCTRTLSPYWYPEEIGQINFNRRVKYELWPTEQPKANALASPRPSANPPEAI